MILQTHPGEARQPKAVFSAKGERGIASLSAVSRHLAVGNDDSRLRAVIPDKPIKKIGLLRIVVYLRTS
jgi:hypothetical protein